MANTQYITQEGSATWAAATKTLLAVAKLRLAVGIVVSAATTKAMLVAAEATFDGYTSGGYTLTVWTGPLNFTGGGSVITSPLVNPAYSTPSDPPVGNSVNAWWIEDATGNVYLAGNFDPVIPMNQIGDGFPFLNQFVIGRNAQQA